MFKKTTASAIATTVILSSSLISVSAFDLDDLDNLFGTDTTITTTDSNNDTIVTSTGTAQNVVISSMEVIPEAKSLPADGGLSSTTIFVRVNDDQENALTETDIELNVSILNNSNGEKGIVDNVSFDSVTQIFEVKYFSGNEQGNIMLNIEAVSKADNTVRLEQIEDFTLTEFIPVSAPVDEAPITDIMIVMEEPNNVETTSLENTILTDMDAELVATAYDVEDNTLTDDKSGVNITSAEIVDENRLRVNFDREIFLPDNPLSMVEIKKVSDNSIVTISNVSLTENKNGLVILTSDDLGKEEYRLTINEVIDGESRKSVSVINSELTVTGASEIAMLLIALLSILGLGASYKLRKEKM